jgi:ferredoxin--NADP+ reductase
LFSILDASRLAPDVKRFRIAAPYVARHHEAGQFVIVRVTPDGERIPLTVAAADTNAGTITLFVQAIGRTTKLMNMLETGDFLSDVAGPLGKPSEIEHYGRAVVVGGGLGAAIAYPVVAALAEAGNSVIAIVGGRSHDYVLLEEELAAAGAQVVVCTDDGSYGRAGFVTDALRDIINELPIDVVFAAGPIPMMKAVADETRAQEIPTIASLNPIMVDGTGMCGGCRVDVGGTTEFACVDGPEFDAHLVDFALLDRRNRAYTEFERRHLAALDLDEHAAESILAPVRSLQWSGT